MQICYVLIILIIISRYVGSSHVDVDKIFEILFKNYPPRSRIGYGKDTYRTKGNMLTLGKNISVERNGNKWNGYDEIELNLRKSSVNNDSEKIVKKTIGDEKVKKGTRSRPRYPKRMERMRKRQKPNLRNRTQTKNATQVITTIFCPFFGVMKLKSNVKHQDFEGFD